MVFVLDTIDQRTTKDYINDIGNKIYNINSLKIYKYGNEHNNLIKYFIKKYHKKIFKISIINNYNYDSYDNYDNYHDLNYLTQCDNLLSFEFNNKSKYHYKLKQNMQLDNTYNFLLNSYKLNSFVLYNYVIDCKYLINCINLTNFKLKNCVLINPKYLSKCINLKYLVISTHYNYDGKSLNIYFIKKLINLRYLSINEYNICNNNLKYLLNLKKLHTLALQDNNLKINKYFCNFILLLPSLKQFIMDNYDKALLNNIDEIIYCINILNINFDDIGSDCITFFKKDIPKKNKYGRMRGYDGCKYNYRYLYNSLYQNQKIHKKINNVEFITKVNKNKNGLKIN